MNDSRIVGCILGTAVGDAIGLPYEGVSRQRLGRLLGPPERHRFLIGRGMISDDTEHTCLVAQSLIASGSDVDVFMREFGCRLRWWFASLPAGLGRGTLRSTTGEKGIPDDWLSRICEWPRSVNWMRRLSFQLVQSHRSPTPAKPISANFFATLVRNLGFLAVVLFHGFRRLLPPY